MRKLLLGAVLISFAFHGAADLDSRISKSCSDGYEPLVSMPAPNETYSNIGTDDTYEYKVCVDGISESYVAPSCEGNVGFYMSSRSTDAHFSAIEGYNMRVCTGNMVTEVKDSCSENQTALFRVSERINGFGRHVAGLAGNVYDSVVCGSKSSPSTVTVKMSYEPSSVDRTYFDDQEVGSLQYSSIAEYPYIVNEKDGVVSGLVAPSFREARKNTGDSVNISLKRDAARSGFFVPLTQNDYRDVEDDQSAVLNRRFENRPSPNFAGLPSDDPTVRTVLEPDVDVDSNLSVSSGTYTLEIEKTAEDEVRISTR